MKASIKLDMREFDRTFRAYAAESKRDSADLCNRAAFDVARWSIEETKRASKEDIKNLEKKTWWPKYIAKRIKRGVTVRFGQKSKGTSIKGFRKVKFQGHYTRAQAKRVSSKIIQARIRSIAFLAAGWLPSVHKFASVIFGSKPLNRAPGGVKQYGRPKGEWIVAQVGIKPSAWIINASTVATRFNQGGDPSPVIEAGLNKAFIRKQADWQKVIEDRLQKTANRVFR